MLSTNRRGEKWREICRVRISRFFSGTQSPLSSEEQSGVLRSYALIFFLTACIYAGVYGVALRAHHGKETPQLHLTVPDPKPAALALLARQFTGPRYFQSMPCDSCPPYSLTRENAEAQMDRIVQMRHLPKEDCDRLRRLIELLSEASADRLTVRSRVDLLRLNLALDTLH